MTAAQHSRNELLLIVVILIFGVFVCLRAEYVRLFTGAESMLDSHGSNLPYYLERERCLLNNSYQMEFEID